MRLASPMHQHDVAVFREATAYPLDQAFYVAGIKVMDRLGQHDQVVRTLEPILWDLPEPAIDMGNFSATGAGPIQGSRSEVEAD